MTRRRDARARRDLPAPLSPDEQRARCLELVAARAAGDARTVERLRSLLVSRNQRLVFGLAARSSRRQRVPVEDLAQEGNIGLLRAIDRYDPYHAGGASLPTFARWDILHAMQRGAAEVGSLVHVPEHARQRRRALNRHRAAFATDMGRPPTDDELAALAGVSLEDVEADRALVLSAPTSLDAPIGEGTDTQLDQTADTDLEAVDGTLERHEAAVLLRRLVDELPPRERTLIVARYGLDDREGCTLGEVGERTLNGASREWARVVEQGALVVLHRRLTREHHGAAE